MCADTMYQCIHAAMPLLTHRPWSAATTSSAAQLTSLEAPAPPPPLAALAARSAALTVLTVAARVGDGALLVACGRGGLGIQCACDGFSVYMQYRQQIRNQWLAGIKRQQVTYEGCAAAHTGFMSHRCTQSQPPLQPQANGKAFTSSNAHKQQRT